MMKLGEYIKTRRNVLGLSLADLAQLLAKYDYIVERQTISHWENGRNNAPIEVPHFRRALALALSVDINELVQTIGLVIPDADHTPEARIAVNLIDSMPEDKRKLAIGILEQILAG